MIRKKATLVQASHQKRPVNYWEQGHDKIKQKLDEIIEESAIALIYNGISHAVMMATPANLEEFAVGFSLSEGIISKASQIYDIQITSHEKGIEINIQISTQQMSALKSRRRNLVGRTGCGLCGSESLEQAIRPVNTGIAKPLPSTSAIQRAISQQDKHQKLQALTGAVHGVAWCDNNGEITLLCEDVGRHNALDKLIGLLSFEQVDTTSGFALISSRASYEMIQKISSVNIPTLVAVSAPTSLAITLATVANINLIGFARPGRYVVYTNI